MKTLLVALVVAVAVQARPFTVVAYNVENLFDLDGIAAYDEYAAAKYTPAHALTKLQNIAKVVARFDDGRGPDVLMLCELEVDATPGKRRRTTTPSSRATRAPSCPRCSAENSRRMWPICRRRCCCSRLSRMPA